MYHVTETRKQNAQRKADLDNARNGTFAPLRHGGVLIRSGAVSKTLDGKDAVDFLAKVRDKGTGYIRLVVASYFTPATA